MSHRFPRKPSHRFRLLSKAEPPVISGQSSLLGFHRINLFGSPLVEGVRPANLRFPRRGGIAVSLESRWMDMLADLPNLGRVLIITRNAGAVIGRFQDYPILDSHSEAESIAQGGGLAIDFAHWSCANARERREGQGVRYSIDVANLRGSIVHRICLTPESHFDQFTSWVKTYQASALTGVGLDSENLSQKPTSPPAEARQEALAGFLRELMVRKLRVRVLIGNDSVSQSHTFAFEELRDQGSTLFCAGEDTAWHIVPGMIGTLELESSHCRGGYRLRAMDRDGTSLFVLTPGRDADLGHWNPIASRASAALAELNQIA